MTSSALRSQSAEHELGPDQKLYSFSTWENKSCWEAEPHVSLNTKQLSTAKQFLFGAGPSPAWSRRILYVRKGIHRPILALQGPMNKMSLGKIKFICCIYLHCIATRMGFQDKLLGEKSGVLLNFPAIVGWYRDAFGALATEKIFSEAKAYGEVVNLCKTAK